MNTVLILGKDYCHSSISTFYKTLAELIKYPLTDNSRFDCTKVCITKETQDEIMDYYKDKGSEDYEIAALLAQIGPKANVSAYNPNGLDFHYVALLEDGFIREDDDESQAYYDSQRRRRM